MAAAALRHALSFHGSQIIRITTFCLLSKQNLTFGLAFCLAAAAVLCECALQDSNAPLGRGGYGTVHRGRLRGLDVAIKLLDADSMQGQQDFDREVLVLGSLHHPHLLPLLGSCPELPALVYPFMENGSLQQRLFGRPGAAAGVGAAARAEVAAAPQASASAEPLLWWDRVRIAHETVLALMWLHGQQPPIWHMDVKPDNILLNR